MAEARIGQMIAQRLQPFPDSAPSLRRAMNPKVRGHERTDQPRPHRALVVRGVTLLRIAVVAPTIARIHQGLGGPVEDSEVPDSDSAGTPLVITTLRND